MSKFKKMTFDVRNLSAKERIDLIRELFILGYDHNITKDQVELMEYLTTGHIPEELHMITFWSKIEPYETWNIRLREKDLEYLVPVEEIRFWKNKDSVFEKI